MLFQFYPDQNQNIELASVIFYVLFYFMLTEYLMTQKAWDWLKVLLVVIKLYP